MILLLAASSCLALLAPGPAGLPSSGVFIIQDYCYIVTSTITYTSILYQLYYYY